MINILNREYSLKLDLRFRCNNPDMQFMQFDKNTSDFFICIERGTEDVDLSNAIITLAVIKPDNTTDAMFLDIRNNELYANLKHSMKDLIGTYQARAMLVSGDETVTTDVITYTVNEDKILSQLNSDIVSDERYSILTDMLNNLSEIETNETNRVEAEKLREKKIKELIDKANKAIQNINSTIENEVNKIVPKIVNDTTNEYLGTVKEDLENAVNDANTKIEEVDSKISEVNNFIDKKNNQVNDFIEEANANIGKAIKAIPPKSELMGQNGKSSYEIAVDNGFVGDEIAYLESLKGKNGADGKNGKDGKNGVDGTFNPNTEFQELETTNKTVLGAINELFNAIKKINDADYVTRIKDVQRVEPMSGWGLTGNNINRLTKFDLGFTIFEFQVTALQEIANNAVSFMLPSGFTPSVTFIPITFSIGSGTGSGFIYKNGQVKFNGTYAKGTIITGSCLIIN